MKVKFRTANRKTKMVDGELISRCGGVLACVPITTNGGGTVYGVTHTLTGTSIKTNFLSARKAEKFARGFYSQCSNSEKTQLRTQSDVDILRQSLGNETRRFVQNYQIK